MCRTARQGYPQLRSEAARVRAAAEDVAPSECFSDCEAVHVHDWMGNGFAGRTVSVTLWKSAHGGTFRRKALLCRAFDTAFRSD